MKKTIEKFNISHVWHFTDVANLPLIQKHRGLFSLAELERRRIEVPTPGGNELSHSLDKGKGLHEFVHLAFLAYHPMLWRAMHDGRISDPLWLKISPSIILNAGVKFCAEVSNKSGATILDHDQAAEEIDFEVLFTRVDREDQQVRARRRAALKSEILIPDFVPISAIQGAING